MELSAGLSKHHFEAIFILVFMTHITGIRSHLCSPGTVTHTSDRTTFCCLPTDCEPDHYVKFCEQNGTTDTCHKCPRSYRLLKRTSSFAVEPCHIFPLDPYPSCKPAPVQQSVWIYTKEKQCCSTQQKGSFSPSQEDKKNCYCDLEQGLYYMEPQVPMGPTSYCQPFPETCKPGFQPTQDGDCKQCSKGTFQNEDNSSKLCRPQKNCTAMKLATLKEGSLQSDAVCETPPTQPSETSPEISSMSASKTTPISTSDPTSHSGSTRTSHLHESVNSDVTYIVLITVICVLLIGVLVALVLFGHKKGWFHHLIRICHQHDIEGRSSVPQASYQTPAHDNDNDSNNSCCACAESCLSTSSKPNSSHSGKSGTDSGGAKAPDLLFTNLQDTHRNGQYVNMNGQSAQKDYSLEPYYHSLLTPDFKDHKDVNGYINGTVLPRTVMLKSEDFYNYPNKVAIPAENENDDCEYIKKDLKKNHFTNSCLSNRPCDLDCSPENKEFTETDPLLANYSTSSVAETPLRNASNRNLLPGAGDDLNTVIGGRSGQAGNRPLLSFLLAESSDTSNPTSGNGDSEPNVPFFSRLLSSMPSGNARSVQSTSTDDQRQQLQHLQLQQEAATLTLRCTAVPTVLASTQAQDVSVVKMDELKSGIPVTTESERQLEFEGNGQTLPAQIIPVTHEEVRVLNNRVVSRSRPTGFPITPATATSQATALNRDLEETLRKEAILVSSSGEEDTQRKSVGGSSGLGESLDIPSSLSPFSDESHQARAAYKRSNSEMSRSVSPSPLPLPRSISSPEEKHRPFAVVKPMQSDQSLNSLVANDLMQPLDTALRNYPLYPRHHAIRRQLSQESSSDDHEETRPKTPDRLSEEEDEDGSDRDEGEHTLFLDDSESQSHNSDLQNVDGKSQPSDQGKNG